MPDCTYFLVPELTEPGRGAEVCLVSKRMFIPDDTPVLVEKYYILTRRNKRTLNMVACSATSVESCLCLKVPREFPNVLFAATTAHAKGLKVIGLTGAKDSKLKDMSDVCIKAPQTETYMIQELHLPIYHCLSLVFSSFCSHSNW